jgi:DNA-binding beta-propeller fold protein YncE
LGTLKSANGVAVDPAGNIFVSDLDANAIFEFSPAGAVLTEIRGKKTNLTSPMGIALSPKGLAAGSDDLYVANSLRGSILLFNNVNSIGAVNMKGTLVLRGNKTRITIPIGVAPL